MKLLNTIATTAVISTSLFAAAPSEAFWGTGEGEPTYSNLMRDSYKFNHKTQSKVYDSPGWLLMTVNSENGDVRKMKLVDCQASRCIYFMRVTEDRDKSVFVTQLDCREKKQRGRVMAIEANNSGWMSWSSLYSKEYQVAFNKFCR